MREGSDWPPAVEIANPDGASPVVLLCPHASNHIPAEYGNLGLSPAELQRHIAWDIGAAGVTRRLSQILNASAFIGTYSRLLIDNNRPLHSASSIVTRSEDTDIPGNAVLTDDERSCRAATIFAPYHESIRSHLAEREATKRPVVIVAIHSFTPTYQGISRAWHAGVLFEQSVRFGQATIERIRAGNSALNVGANVPYTVTPDNDHALLVYGDNVGNPAIEIEIRQDLIARTDDHDRWAQYLAQTLAIDVALRFVG